jgi:hypothetical protein
MYYVVVERDPSDNCVLSHPTIEGALPYIACREQVLQLARLMGVVSCHRAIYAWTAGKPLVLALTRDRSKWPDTLSFDKNATASLRRAVAAKGRFVVPGPVALQPTQHEVHRWHLDDNPYDRDGILSVGGEVVVEVPLKKKRKR